MPHQKVRGVNRGIQDEEELNIILHQKNKRNRKAKKWFAMIGLTVLEFVLCLLCFAFGYWHYHTIEAYRNAHQVKFPRSSVRYILEPPMPLAIASVFSTLCYVDLMTWQSLRPIAYFGWIMVATAGFLMFLLYAGVILLTSNDICTIIAIVLGILTALVFLADLICMLVSLKRFPVPHRVLQRRYDKCNKCVCAAEEDVDELEVERPICRCGNNWGEPCKCDKHDIACGCGADKRAITVGDWRECAARTPVLDDDDGTTIYGSVVDESGMSFLNEGTRTILIPTSTMNDYCWQHSEKYCIDGPRRQAVEGMSQKSIAEVRKIRLANPSMTTTTRLLRPSKVVTRGLSSPLIAMAAKMESPYRALTKTLEARSTILTSKIAQNKSPTSHSVYTTTIDDKEERHPIGSKYGCKRKKPPQPKKSILRKSMFCDEKGETIQMISTSSDEELGEGDYPRKRANNEKDLATFGDFHEYHGNNIEARTRFSKYKATKCLSKLNSAIGYMSDPEFVQSSTGISMLPGQVLSLDDSDLYRYKCTKKNVSVSARERCSRRASSEFRTPSKWTLNEQTRPKTSSEVLGGPQIIRNVSTTVRAVRTLSRVVEADDESRSISQMGVNKRSNGFPSESTITIYK